MGLSGHVQAKQLAAQEGPQRVDVEMAADVGGGDFFQRPGFPDGGTVDQGFHMAEMIDHPGQHVADRLLVAQLGLHRDRLPSGLAQLGGRGFGGVQRTVGVDHDVVTHLGQVSHDAVSHTGGSGAGHDGDGGWRTVGRHGTTDPDET